MLDVSEAARALAVLSQCSVTICIRARCKGQGVIALSSGEAEYYGLTIGMSKALGDYTPCADLNVEVAPQCLLDATTAISIGSRRGLGIIDTVFLWVHCNKRSQEVTELSLENAILPRC